MDIDCTSWIVDMEDIVNNSGLVLTGIGKEPPTIYRVLDRSNQATQMLPVHSRVSLGSFHYGEPDLIKMEDQKKEVVLNRVKRLSVNHWWSTSPPSRR